jgi:hypothetical protein
MKTISRWALVVVIFVFSACGNGGSTDSKDASSGSGSDPWHEFSVANNMAKVEFAMVDGYIVNVSNSAGEAASVKLADVCLVVWNGDVAQWSLSPTSKYATTFIFKSVMIPVPDHDIGIVRIMNKKDEVFSINTSKTKLQSGMMLDPRKLISF